MIKDLAGEKRRRKRKRRCQQEKVQEEEEEEEERPLGLEHRSNSFAPRRLTSAPRVSQSLQPNWIFFLGRDWNSNTELQREGVGATGNRK